MKISIHDGTAHCTKVFLNGIQVGRIQEADDVNKYVVQLLTEKELLVFQNSETGIEFAFPVATPGFADRQPITKSGSIPNLAWCTDSKWFLVKRTNLNIKIVTE